MHSLPATHRRMFSCSQACTRAALSPRSARSLRVRKGCRGPRWQSTARRAAAGKAEGCQCQAIGEPRVKPHSLFVDAVDCAHKNLFQGHLSYPHPSLLLQYWKHTNMPAPMDIIIFSRGERALSHPTTTASGSLPALALSSSGNMTAAPTSSCGWTPTRPR